MYDFSTEEWKNTPATLQHVKARKIIHNTQFVPFFKCCMSLSKWLTWPVNLLDICNVVCSLIKVLRVLLTLLTLLYLLCFIGWLCPYLLQAEVTEKKRFEEKKKQESLRQNKSVHQHRVEIWIKQDGSSSQSKVDDNEEEDLSKLDAIQVGK